MLHVVYRLYPGLLNEHATSLNDTESSTAVITISRPGVSLMVCIRPHCACLRALCQNDVCVHGLDADARSGIASGLRARSQRTGMHRDRHSSHRIAFS